MLAVPLGIFYEAVLIRPVQTDDVKPPLIVTPHGKFIYAIFAFFVAALISLSRSGSFVLTLSC